MKYQFLFFIIALNFTTKAQNITGQWETYDDKTKEKKAIIEIYKTDNTYSAKIIKNYEEDEEYLKLPRGLLLTVKS